jgi:uncharacterized iron-regulated membrane protein
MSQRALRIWLCIHKWSSLISTAFLLMLCLTGLPLIFSHEIEEWLEPRPPAGVTRAQAPPPTLDALVNKVLSARSPGHVAAFVYFPPDMPEGLWISTAETAAEPTIGTWPGFHTQLLDRRTGEVISEVPEEESGFMAVMLQLHKDMYAGLAGMLFLGVMGLLMLAAIGSGIVLYGPFMRKLDFGTVRDGKPRTRWLDLHNLLGIVTLVWTVIVGGTGAISTISDPLFGTWQSTELAEMVTAYKDAPPVHAPVPLDTVIQSAQAAEPGMQPVNVAFPGNDFAGPHHYTVFLNGNSSLTSKLVTTILVDAETGEVIDSRPMPWYIKMLLVSQPLHFGDYGGITMKILWALLDVVTIIVLISGLYLWFAKAIRQKRGVASLANRPALEAAE